MADDYRMRGRARGCPPTLRNGLKGRHRGNARRPVGLRGRRPGTARLRGRAAPTGHHLGARAPLTHNSNRDRNDNLGPNNRDRNDNPYPSDNRAHPAHPAKAAHQPDRPATVPHLAAAHLAAAPPAEGSPAMPARPPIRSHRMRGTVRPVRPPLGVRRPGTEPSVPTLGPFRLSTWWSSSSASRSG